MWEKVRSKAQVDRLALGAQAVYPQQEEERHSKYMNINDSN